MATTSPIYDPGQAFSGKAHGGAVTGGRILKVAAAKTDGNATPVAHCGASDHPIGASGADAAQDKLLPVYPPHVVMPLECAGDVTAGAAVEVAADGKVQALNSGKKVGVAFTAGSTSSPALVQLQL